MMSPSLLAELKLEIERKSLPDDFMVTVETWYLSVAQKISQAHLEKQAPLLVSFNGAQGSGKSTLTAFLSIILNHEFGLHTVELSIDDFYLTQKERLRLASEIHPLFSTRGVPGTHDINLIRDTIDGLQKCSDKFPCHVPRFNKAIDDREPKSGWSIVKKSVDVILFEGWCNHAPVQSEQDLKRPINDLERDEDEWAVWRLYANEQLKEYHQQFFSQADLLIYLQVPSFEKVYEWRGLQEKKLAELSEGDKQAVMNEKQLRHFIQHYERITRLCLKELPSKADVVLKLNDWHEIESLQIS